MLMLNSILTKQEIASYGYISMTDYYKDGYCYALHKQVSPSKWACTEFSDKNKD